MITSKQRAALRSMANGIEPILQVGKAGIGENLIKQASDALTARELLKVTVLDNSSVTPKEAALSLAEQTGAEVVQVIGSKAVLYRPNPELKEKSIQNKLTV